MILEGSVGLMRQRWVHSTAEHWFKTTFQLTVNWPGISRGLAGWSNSLERVWSWAKGPKLMLMAGRSLVWKTTKLSERCSGCPVLGLLLLLLLPPTVCPVIWASRKKKASCALDILKLAGRYTLGGEGLAVIAEELKRVSELVGETLPAKAVKGEKRKIKLKMQLVFFFNSFLISIVIERKKK